MIDDSTATEDEKLGMAWWNGLTEQARARWLDEVGNTGVPADAWVAYKKSTAALIS